MKKYTVHDKKIIEVKIVKNAYGIRDTKDVIYQDGHISYCIDEHMINYYFGNSKKQAFIKHKETLLKRISFYTEEINKLKKEINDIEKQTVRSVK